METEKDKELKKEIRKLYNNSDINAIIHLLTNWDEASLLLILFIDDLLEMTLPTKEQKETLKTIKKEKLKSQSLLEKYQEIAKSEKQNKSTNKYKTYTNKNFIDSTITIDEVDIESKVGLKLEKIFHKYEEFGWRNYPWRVYVGDLDFEHTFILEGHLIVTGNLTIHGDYIDALANSALIVLGNMAAENIISHDPLYIFGNTTAQKLIYCYGNDFVGEFNSHIQAQLVCIEDRDFRGSGKCNCPIRNSFNDNYLTIQDIEPFLDEVVHIEEYKDYDVEIRLNRHRIIDLLKQGKTIYK